MKIYHITTRDRAKKISRSGFCDATGSYMLEATVLTGVFVSDCILDANEGVFGGSVFVLNIPEDLLVAYEIVEYGKGYREWCVPAKLLNKYFSDRTIYREGDLDFTPRTGI